MNRCPSCKGELENGVKFCSNCGTNLERSYLENPVCPKCKRKYPSGITTCEADGMELVEESLLAPKCVICHREYPGGTQFCPEDGGRLIPEAFHKEKPSPFEMGRKPGELEVRTMVERDFEVNTWDYLSKGWDMFRENPGPLMGFAAATIGVNLLLRLIPIVGMILHMALMAPIVGGFYVYIFKVIKRQEREFPDFLKGFNYFLPLLLANLLIGFFTVAGLFLLVVPGIYLGVCYLFTLPLIVDRDIDFWSAMELSRKIVKKNWFKMFNFSLLLLLINLGGVLLFLVGLLISIPLSLCTMSIAYDDIIGIETEFF
jgi:hypothetical protein